MIRNSTNFDNKYNKSSTKEIWGNKGLMDYEIKRYQYLFEKNCKILDLGIGEGVNSIALARLGFDVTGIDISSRALEICRECETRINLINEDINNYRIKENMYGVIMARYSLHFLHKKDFNRVIMNIKKGLTQNGIVYLTVFSINDDIYIKAKNQYKHNNMLHAPNNNSYVSFFSKEEILQLFSEFETIFVSEEYFLDRDHGEGVHYHSVIKYLGRKGEK